MQMPTGAGKSLVLAEAIRIINAGWPETRVLMLTHVRELIAQNFEKLMSIWPDAPAGIYSAGLGRKDARAQILYAGIQSVCEKALQIGWVDLVFIDECHLVPTKGMGRYRKFLDALKRINPDLRVIGLTATPFRLDSGYLVDGDIFDDIATSVEIPELLDGGYLAPLVTKATFDVNMAGVRRTGGDFNLRDVEAAYAEQNVIPAALADAMMRAQDRRSWLVFTPTVAMAEQAVDILNAAGISAASVDGAMDAGQRDDVISRFKRGEISALANCQVLTTGFDAPAIDLIINLRPTESTALYIQMMGRGMRLAPGKTDCLVLDYAGNIQRHGCVDDPIVKVPKAKREKGEAPTKTCPDCRSVLHASVRECRDCGYQFPANPPAIDSEAADDAILTRHQQEKQHQVSWARLAEHNKPGSPTSLRVDYFSSDMLAKVIASEWVCIEHPGFVGHKAKQWWARMGGEHPAPETVAEALKRQDELVLPVGIRTKKDGKYLRVVGYQFAEETAA